MAILTHTVIVIVIKRHRQYRIAGNNELIIILVVPCVGLQPGVCGHLCEGDLDEPGPGQGCLQGRHGNHTTMAGGAHIRVGAPQRRGDDDDDDSGGISKMQ